MIEGPTMNDVKGDAKAVFLEALDCKDADELMRFLEQSCGLDVALRTRVEELMRAHRDAGAFLGGAEKQTSTFDQPIAERPGSVIGPYKLLQQIGEGGMGVVFMAEQTHPVQRKVALKVIKAGMDSRQVIARFEAERQALAMMDHVNIARVLDAGETPPAYAGGSPRPYFVMELVHGVPITKYCDDSHLTPRERLELFVPVCQAIQHAHQKGIIHRDIKPSNVMITLYDGEPVPKVIDFGVAKAAEQKLTERTLFTQYGTMVGTLEYMSPEQAEMSALGVDTRSDIYSLGVLLYELLTGSTPLSAKRVREAAYGEVLRMIKEEEPPKPSTRLSDSGEALASISTQRHMEPAKLTKLVRGELDWIVMKALEKDRNRRYESASAFAADVQRYLDDEPVLACPPSTWYRFRKFARRSKRAVATATVLALAVLVAVVVLATSTVLIAHSQQTTAAALTAETQAKGELSEALDHQQHDSYFHRIALAYRELSADNLGGALELLDGCPEYLRNWEWDYLNRLCRVEPLVFRDTCEVLGVAFDSKGGRIATACGDHTVKIRDSRTGKVVQTLRGHEGDVFSVAFSPDDGHLASASADRTVRLWDLATGRSISLPGHVGDYAGMANAVAFSPDSRQVVAGGEDGVATVWDVTDGRPVHRLPEKHEYTATCAAFSPDGTLLATGSWGGVLRIWDARTGQLRCKIDGHTRRISAVVFHRDSRWLATASFDRLVKVWDATTGELLKTMPGPMQTMQGHTGVISGLVFSRDGRRLFSSGGEDKTVKVWDLLSGREVLNLRGHSLFCHCLASSRDGLRLASAGKDGTIRIWDATPEKGDEALVSRTHDSEVWSMAFSSDGRYLASGGWGGTVQLWDAQTVTLLRTFPLPPNVLNVFRVAFSPDGKRLAAAWQSRNREAVVHIWETATGQEVPEPIRETRSMPFCATFDPKGRYVIREGPEYTVQVRDAKTGVVAGIVGRHARQIWCMEFSPDRQRLVTASNDGTVRLWAWDPECLGREPQQELEFDVRVDGYSNRVAFSPDGLRLATGGEGHTVKIWDAKTGPPELKTLNGHTGDVFAVAFSPDGRWLATAGEDTTIRIWDTKSWKLRHTMRGHTGFVMSLAFSPDSERLASGSRDHTMKVWDTARWEEVPDR
jgi:eukaryotic-like serine/threonine-protein kinase